MSVDQQSLDQDLQTTGRPVCSFRSPLDGWQCNEPAVTGGDRPLCILHDPSPTKSPEAFQATIDRRIQAGECWFDGIVCHFPVSFQGRCFTGTTSFHAAEFHAAADFRDTSFKGPTTLFTDCFFSGGEVDFAGASFSGSRTDFSRAVFQVEAVSFEWSSFLARETRMQEASFDTVRGVAFAGSRFLGERVSFQRAMFRGHAIFFEGVRFSAEDVDFSECQFDGDLLSFEEVIQTKGRLTFSKSIAQADQISFAGGRWNGDVLLLTRLNWTVGRLEFRGVKMGLANLLSLNAARIQGKLISFNESVFLTPRIDLAWARFSATHSIRFEQIDWEGRIVGTGVRLESDVVSFERAHFGGECLELTSARFRSQILNARQAQFLCSRVSFSNVSFHVETVDFSKCHFGGSHIYFHRMRWHGDRFLISGARFSAKRLSFNRAALQGQRFELKDCDLSDCQVSFWETHFGGTYVDFSGLKGTGAQVKFKAFLKNVHFDPTLEIPCDLTNSRWPGEGFLRRPKLLEEHTAREPWQYAALEDSYTWIARQFERFGRRRRANDFYYSAYECRRRRYASEKRHVDRWKMEFLKWCMGYRLTPSRYAPLVIVFGFLSSFISTVSSWWPGHRS